MRWATKSTWIHRRAAASTYWCRRRGLVSRVSDSMEIVKEPRVPDPARDPADPGNGVWAWDGVKEGFSLLWLLARLLCVSLAPMCLFLNSGALIYGVGYSLLGFGAHSVGAFIPRAGPGGRRCARRVVLPRVCGRGYSLAELHAGVWHAEG